MSLVNSGKVQGSPQLKCDRIGCGQKISAESLQTKFKIKKRAVAKCPSVDIKIMGEICLHCWILAVWLFLCDKHILIGVLGCSWDQPKEQLLRLKSANGGGISLSRYVKLHTKFFGLKAPRVRFSITQNTNEVLDPEHKTKLSGIIEWNLVRLAYKEFIKKQNPIVFEKQKGLVYTEAVTKNKEGKIISKKLKLHC